MKNSTLGRNSAAYTIVGLLPYEFLFCCLFTLDKSSYLIIILNIKRERGSQTDTKRRKK